jgi:transposase
MMLADKGYDGDDVRSSLLMHGILPVIPPKANRKEPIACDFKAYKDRNRIERMFNRLKQFRRIATRYDKTALSFISFLCLAAAKLWLPSFVNRPKVTPQHIAHQTEQRCYEKFDLMSVSMTCNADVS